jgi:hypothetical protein
MLASIFFKNNSRLFICLFIYIIIIVWDDMSYQYRIFLGGIIVDYAIKFCYQIID